MTIPPWLDPKDLPHAEPVILNGSGQDPTFIAMMCFWMTLSAPRLDYQTYWPRRRWN